MDVLDRSKIMKDELEITDDEIWTMFSGPIHRQYKEKDNKYQRYAEMLLKKIGIVEAQSNKHTINFCQECFTFISFEGKELIELGHPRHQLITKTKLCKKENIKDLDSFIEWNIRNKMRAKYKGRINEMMIAPTFNCYHRASEYDGLKSNSEKREYVIELERKVKKLISENEMLRKRLLVSHVFEFASAGVGPHDLFK